MFCNCGQKPWKSLSRVSKWTNKYLFFKAYRYRYVFSDHQSFEQLFWERSWLFSNFLKNVSFVQCNVGGFFWRATKYYWIKANLFLIYVYLFICLFIFLFLGYMLIFTQWKNKFHWFYQIFTMVYETLMRSGHWKNLP